MGEPLEEKVVLGSHGEQVPGHLTDALIAIHGHPAQGLVGRHPGPHRRPYGLVVALAGEHQHRLPVVRRKANFFLSEDMLACEPWFDWIRERLAESNLPLLIFTELTATWDWCLYEAGMFTHLEGEDRRRVICLHNARAEPPKPLEHLQSVPAAPESVAQFLAQFFGNTTLTGTAEPINSPLADNPDQLARLAASVCGHFKPLTRVKRHLSGQPRR